MQKLHHILNPLYSDIFEVKNQHETIFAHRPKNSKEQPNKLLELVYKSLANSPLIQKTIELRDLQKLYFESRDRETLKACKQLEFEVDIEISKVKRLLK